VVEGSLEGLGRGRVLAEQPEGAAQALQGVRPFRPRLCPLDREGKAGSAGGVAGGRLGVTELGEQL
jgi:hypothetical protein